MQVSNNVVGRSKEKTGERGTRYVDSIMVLHMRYVSISIYNDQAYGCTAAELILDAYGFNIWCMNMQVIICYMHVFSQS